LVNGMSIQVQGKPKLVVIGGGFGGVETIKRLPKNLYDITLIDRRNFHLFQPLLYQVATGALPPSQIASPLRAIFRDRPDVRVIQAEVSEILSDERLIVYRASDLKQTISYDYLVVATGSTHSYFGRDEWQPLAPGLKTVEDALTIRERVYRAFEMAELEQDPVQQQAYLTFAIVGAGATGVELAGALKEVASRVLIDEFRSVDVGKVQVILLEGAPRVLGTFKPAVSQQALEMLESIGVQVLLNTMVTAVRSDGVAVFQKGASDFIPARTVLWTAGVAASPLGRALAAQYGCSLDKAGRVVVQADLTVDTSRRVFVIGDLAHVEDKAGATVPGTASVAMSQGAYVAAQLQRASPEEWVPYEFREKPLFAVVGRNQAVAQYGSRAAGGPFVWLAWAFVHVLFLIEFRNRFQVMLIWMWSYGTHELPDRLILEGLAKGGQTARSEND
jgi:NADH dehydrogenase